MVFPPVDQLGDLHDRYLNVLCKFNEENGVSTKYHLTSFQDCTDNFLVEVDDVFSRMFVHSLEGEARKWLRNLPNNSITHWMQFVENFSKKWGMKKDNRHILIEFNSRRNNGKTMKEFTT